MELEDQKEAYKANEDWKRTLDEAGIEYSVTNDVSEARRGFAKISTMVLLPNVLKTASAMTNMTESGLKSVDDVIKAAGKLTRVGGAKQGFINESAIATYNNLTKGATQVRGQLYRLKDGTLINFHKSTQTGISTIDINKAGEIFKIRGN